jgi:hypothetical protein
MRLAKSDFCAWDGLIFRTANTAVAESPAGLVFDCATTANALPEQLADGWHVLAPFGEFPEPGGRYVQVFGASQADAMIRSWNSIAGRSFRWLKNVRHRLKPSLSMPIFDAPPGACHPDLDPSDWSKLPIVGEVTELRATANAIEGKVLWSDSARRGDRERGPLHPSINWWHDRPDAAGRVYPEHVESVTLTRTPNIRTVPAWTANADLSAIRNPQSEIAPTLPGTSPEENQQHTQPMNQEQLNALRKSLGLPETADPAACITAATTANAALATLAERDAALNTANSTVSTLNTERDTLRTQHGAITTERDTLKTANTALNAERDAITVGILDVAEKRGIITPAEREAFKTRISTANTAADALKELATRKPAMNTQSVEINGTRLDLSTANARQGALQDAVAKRQKADDCDYDTAYARAKADPNFSALFAAMQDPAKAKA